MQNVKLMLKSPRFMLGFSMVFIIIVYAVFYPIINAANPKENRIENPNYQKILALNEALDQNDAEAALTQIDTLLSDGNADIAGSLEQVRARIETTALEKALSGAKQVKGSKYPAKAEFDELRESLTLPEDATPEQINHVIARAYEVLDGLETHHSAIIAAAQLLREGGEVADIEDAAVRAEFEAIADAEDTAAEIDAIVSAHEANYPWIATVRQRLAGEELDFSDVKKFLSSEIPQSFLIQKNQPPSAEHLLGTDMHSRDVLIELAHGARVSLLVGLIAGVIATIIGLSLGLFAGYVGGWIDNTISAFTNLFLVIPSFVILILISVAVGQIREAWVTGLMIGLTAWPWTAKSVRAQTTSLRNRDHVNMARITGYGTPRIVVTEIMPYIASYVVMAFILQVASGIMAEATLAILGLGDPTAISLGRMISWAQQYESIVNGRWWEFVPVAICIGMITFGLYMMNSGMDQVFNPKIRS